MQLSDRMRALVQAHLVDTEPYDPMFSPTRINLSANENTYGLPPAARAAVDEALSQAVLNRYPDAMANPLRDELASWLGLDGAQICVGNGGDEGIFNFLFAFGGAGRALVTCPPDFSEYAQFAGLTQTAVEQVFRDPDTMLPDADALVAAVARADLAIFTSPNNPTGDLMPLELIGRLCDACPGLVMIDEAYMEFAEPGASALALLPEHDNLVVLRTFSKAFAEAGVRCGYVVAAPDIIDVYAAVRQIYSVSALTQAAALAALRHRDDFAPVIETVRRERTRLHEAVSRLVAGLPAPARTWPSEGNFILVRLPHASRIRERLRDERSILVRDFSYAPGLADCLRITVGTPEENDEVIAALAALIEEEAR